MKGVTLDFQSKWSAAVICECGKRITFGGNSNFENSNCSEEHPDKDVFCEVHGKRCECGKDIRIILNITAEAL